jgi:inhibitor of KinA sporulation pathway (predicted exonuclease)
MYNSFIVFDLEATCDELNSLDSEIIEIGAVKVNTIGQVISEFDVFVHPIVNTVLSPFCIELTKIQQSDVDNALSFTTAIQQFQEWAGKNALFCSWGFYDKKQLTIDSQRYSLDADWIRSHHISLKHQYQAIKGLSRAAWLGKALELENFQFEGTPHRGIHDAINIAKIFSKYLDQWELPQ